MKRVLIIFCCYLFIGVGSDISAATSQTLVAGNDKEGVYLYATPHPNNDLYTNFHVKIGGEVVETYGWEVSMREERQPELHVVDLNQDGIKEIVVILTLGTGTFVVQKEAHILQKVETYLGQKAFVEMDIDDPVHTILRNFRITATAKSIKIAGQGNSWKAENKCKETYYLHRFPLDQSVNWKIEGNNLVAHVGLPITYNCVPAGFILKYKQTGEIYTAKKIKVEL